MSDNDMDTTTNNSINDETSTENLQRKTYEFCGVCVYKIYWKKHLKSKKCARSQNSDLNTQYEKSKEEKRRISHIKYNKKRASMNESKKQCPICMEIITPNPKSASLAEVKGHCGHSIHKKCFEGSKQHAINEANDKFLQAVQDFERYYERFTARYMQFKSVYDERTKATRPRLGNLPIIPSPEPFPSKLPPKTLECPYCREIFQEVVDITH